ncbi:MAG: hypothetical protein J2P25_25400 [Nocardiopsaceae bacterium]|nr:hypothetical protein [Nocardiopsaceae bacterium]
MQESLEDETRTEGQEGHEGPGSWRGRALWAAVIVVAAVALFSALLRISRTYSANSDGSAFALQGWDMIHGNPLLSGWWTSDVSFYSFEIPIDAAVEAVRGLGTDVVHITAAIVYTLLVVVAALVARGHSRGRAGVAAAVIAAGILLAPGYILSTSVLLGSPDHIGVAVPILLTLLLVDRAPERWWVPPVTCVLLVWAQFDDPVASFAGAFALAVVCLVRAGAGWRADRGRAWWYDAALGVAAVVSYGLTRLAVGLLRSAGGISMRTMAKATKFQPPSRWPAQLAGAGRDTLILFGADFPSHPSSLLTAAGLVHLAGVALAVCGLGAGIACLVRMPRRLSVTPTRKPAPEEPAPGTRGDRVTQALTVGTLVTLAAGVFATRMIKPYDAHEIAVVLPFGAVLAGRAVGPWLARRRQEGGQGLAGQGRAGRGWRLRRPLVGALSVVALAYLAFFGYFAAQPPVKGRTQTLDNWLLAHHLTDGIGRYWTGSSTRLYTRGKVRISPTYSNPLRPDPWITRPSWYDPGKHTANFVVAGTDPQVGLVLAESSVIKAFGKPARVYRFGQYIIAVYHRNLLRELHKPVQPQPDTGGFHL